MLAANAYIASLAAVAVFVRHWALLIVWMGMLAAGLGGMFLAQAGYRYWGHVGFALFLGWVIMGSVFGFLTGVWWTIGMFVVAILGLNYIAVALWSREPAVSLSAADLARKRGALLWVPSLFAAILAPLSGLAILYDMRNQTDHTLLAAGMGIGAATLLLLGLVLYWRAKRSSARGVR